MFISVHTVSLIISCKFFCVCTSSHARAHGGVKLIISDVCPTIQKVSLVLEIHINRSMYMVALSVFHVQCK